MFKRSNKLLVYFVRNSDQLQRYLLYELNLHRAFENYLSQGRFTQF